MFCYFSFLRRAFGSARTRRAVLSFEESCDFIRPYAFRGQKEFFEWCRSGGRPAYIPSAPWRTYRNEGWISWPHWLGYERKSVTPPKEPREQDIRVQEAKAKFVAFVTRERPDMEFQQLPKTLKATHLFRIRSEVEPTQAPDVWIPLQIRFSSAVRPRRGQMKHVLRKTADDDTNVIIISAAGGLLFGRADEIPQHCSPSEFVPPDEAHVVVVERLQEWWAVAKKAPAVDIVRSLRVARRGVFGSESLPLLRRNYLDPLSLSLKRSGEFKSYPVVNAIIGDRYGLILRDASFVGNKYHATVHGNMRGKPIDASENFDFLLVMMPSRPEHSSGTTMELFLFPKAVLLRWGVLTTSSCPGRPTIHVFPPYKKSQRKIVDLRKAEHAPFFVNSIERFAEILKEYGGFWVDDSMDGSKKEIKAADSELAKLSL